MTNNLIHIDESPHKLELEYVHNKEKLKNYIKGKNYVKYLSEIFNPNMYLGIDTFYVTNLDKENINKLYQNALIFTLPAPFGCAPFVVGFAKCDNIHSDDRHL